MCMKVYFRSHHIILKKGAETLQVAVNGTKKGKHIHLFNTFLLHS